MSLSIHLLGLHLDAQYGQTWHLSTQLCSREGTGRRLLWSTTLLLPTLLSDSQVSTSLVIHGLWWSVFEQVRAHVLVTCTRGLAQSSSCDCGQWQTMNHMVDNVPVNKIWRQTESTPCSRWWQSYGWNLQRLQSSQNTNKFVLMWRHVQGRCGCKLFSVGPKPACLQASAWLGGWCYQWQWLVTVVKIQQGLLNNS